MEINVIELKQNNHADVVVSPIQPDLKGSVAEFMAYVHTSVNEMSKIYLQNERRYNYTTPKSFLEQIKLYQNLLGQKSKELTAKMERLENGLTKLQSTAQQVYFLSRFRFMWLLRRKKTA